MKILAIWITKGLFIFVVCIAEWNVCSNLDLKIIPATNVEVDNDASYVKRKGNLYIIKLHLKIKEVKESYQDIVDISIIPNKLSFSVGYDISTSSALVFQLNSSGHFVCVSKLNINSNIIIDTTL